MSPPGRPKGEYRSAQHAGTLMHPPGRPKGEYRSAQHAGTLMHPPGRPKGEYRSAQPAGAPTSRFGSAGAQRGISLVTTLLFTVAALLLGISAMGINVMQERMVGNSRDRDLALQAAEAALRDAELDIRNNVSADTAFSDNCDGGLCTAPSQRGSAAALRALPVEKQTGFDWSAAASTRRYGQYTSVSTFPNVLAQPVYVIERLGVMAVPPGTCSTTIPPDPDCRRLAYRVTARATGARAETVVMLQSVYYRR